MHNLPLYVFLGGVVLLLITGRRSRNAAIASAVAGAISSAVASSEAAAAAIAASSQSVTVQVDGGGRHDSFGASPDSAEMLRRIDELRAVMAAFDRGESVVGSPDVVALRRLGDSYGDDWLES